MNTVTKYENSRGDSITFSKNTGLFLTDFPLLSGLPVKISTSQSLNQIGGTVESQLIDPKTVTLKGFIRGNGTEAKKRLLQVIRPMDKGKITVNGEYYMDVYVADTPQVEKEIQFPRFEFGLTAPYPFWQKTASAATALSGVEGMFRFPWNITQTYQFGRLINSFFTNVYNGGQVDSYFDVYITAGGDAENVSFLDIETGKILKLNKALTTGERISILIRPDSVTATSSVDGDIQGLIDIDSTLFSLRPGDNVIKYDAESGRENLSIQIKFADKFAGVVV